MRIPVMDRPAEGIWVVCQPATNLPSTGPENHEEPAPGPCGPGRSPPPQTGDDDPALFMAWRDGDLPAGDRLIRRHAPRLFAFLRQRVGCDQQAWDLVQDTLLACVESQRRFALGSSFRTYLFAIARYRLIHFLMRDTPKRRRTEDDVAMLVDAAPSPQALIEDERSLDELIAAMARLPTPLREVLELFYIESVATADIAARLGIPAATVRTRLHRARALLAARVTDEH